MLKKVSYKDIYDFSCSYWRRNRRYGILAVGFLMLSTVMDIAVPVYSGKIVDAMAQGRDAALRDIIMPMAILLGVVFVLFTARWAAFRFYNRWECYSMRDLLNDAHFKVQRFSTDWHANSFGGGTVTRITRARRSFEIFEDTFFIHIFPTIIIMFGMSAMLIYTIPSVGLYVLAMIVFYVAFSLYTSYKYLDPLYRASAESDTSVGSALADSITSNQTVKAFGMESREDKRFYGVAENWRQKTYKAYKAGNDINYVRDTIRFVMLTGMFGIAYLMWKAGEATPGNITLMITSFFIVSGYLRDIGMYVFNLQQSISEIEDAVYFWKTNIAVEDKPEAKEFEPHSGTIEFDRIRFTYGNQKTPIYDDFSITINAGEKVALVGHSGSGKSTFVKLLQRLYDIQGGEIRIDGQNIADVTQSSLRKALALVPQDPILFHRSLAENIAYGCDDVSEAEIIAASKKAYAHEFIENLPDGYNTLVGERGVKLSGGERQRVAIAPCSFI